MKSETLEELQDLAQELLKLNRLSGSEGIKLVKRRIKELLKSRGIKHQEETFYINKKIPTKGLIELENAQIPCMPYVGSPSGVYEGFIKREPLEEDIALVRVGKEQEMSKAKALITYKELNTFHYGIMESKPTVSVKSEDIKVLEDAYGKLYIETKEEKILCSNIFFDVGRGPILYLIAHIDTKPHTFGAIKNGMGFLLLLFLAFELHKNYNLPYRIRFLFTDANELGLEGAKFHATKDLKHAYYVINLEGIGWHNPAVIYKDLEGYNGHRINESFLRHVEKLKAPVEFQSAPLLGDHIPFKKAGLETLFLTSYPFSLRNTMLDNLEAINWDVVKMWYELILSFLRRLFKA